MVSSFRATRRVIRKARQDKFGAEVGNSEKNRLYVRGRVLGYKRSKHIQEPRYVRVAMEDVTGTEEAQFYVGKKVAYVYKTKSKRTGVTKMHVKWGKVSNVHGNKGTVLARFKVPIHPNSFGRPCRVMLFPSSI
ncbi:MAG: uncharacterized protein KVP18_004122 [Porospora cf. gigantea A]|uniref:uncharacterized protein n=1 Tax=Porospora cf. gigantea A TaxID=2853593 RepID=UPI00355A657D|nr:MAG: hypothetical protein KVP18_004122 [Porospora cf. gigantea A]